MGKGNALPLRITAKVSTGSRMPVRLGHKTNHDCANMHGAEDEDGMNEPYTSCTHPICSTCIHRWKPDGMSPYHPESWCYMFKCNCHIIDTSFCGQYRVDRSKEQEAKYELDHDQPAPDKPKICRCGLAWHMNNIECKDV